MSIKKILVITLSNIGDAVMSTPVLEFLHNKYPQAKFDLVVDNKSKEIFRHCPYVSNLIEKNKKLGIKGNFYLIKNLRKNNYDLAVDLRTDLLLFFIKAKRKLYKINNNNIHSVEKHFLALNEKKVDIPNMKIWLDKENSKIKNYFPNKNKKILTLGLGAHHDFKVWPAKNYAQLTKKINDHYDFIVLLGDKSDQKYSKIFLDNFSSQVIDLCGKLNLLETAAVIKLSNFFIGNDSGLGHISSAVKTPNLIIFGQGNPIRYRPWGGNCFFYQNREQHIKQIKVETILKELKKINF